MGQLDGLKVFLSGPIDRVADSGIAWRREIRQKCEDLPFSFLDPTEKPEEVGGHEVGLEKYKIIEMMKNRDWENASKWSREVRHVDLRMVDRSDLYIIYIDVDSHLCGTYNELFEAERQQKPLFAIMKSPHTKWHIPSWLISIFREEEVFDSVDDCVEHLRKIQSGEIELDSRWLGINV